jgi:hypothetical protein
MFLGAAHVDPRIETVGPSQTRRRNRRLLATVFTPSPEVSLEEALTGAYCAHTIHAANKEWMVIVQKVEGTFEPTHVLVIFGGVIIFGALVYALLLGFTGALKESDQRQKLKRRH